MCLHQTDTYKNIHTWYIRGEVHFSSTAGGHWKNRTRNYYWLLKIRRLYLLQHWNCSRTDLPSCSRSCSLFTKVMRHGDTAGGSWGPNPLFWAGSRAACGKITFGGIPHRPNYCETFIVCVYIHKRTHAHTVSRARTHTHNSETWSQNTTWRAAYCRPGNE